jgi:hypothetical protein
MHALMNFYIGAFHRHLWLRKPLDN